MGVSPWEWIIAAIGMAILGGIIAYLAWEAIARPASGPPDITIEEWTVTRLEGQYLVRFRIANRGNSTGANVQVLGTVFDGDTVLERSTVTFDFVPQRSENDGGLYFKSDPTRYRLDLRAEGYIEP